MQEKVIKNKTIQSWMEVGKQGQCGMSLKREEASVA